MNRSVLRNPGKGISGRGFSLENFFSHCVYGASKILEDYALSKKLEPKMGIGSG